MRHASLVMLVLAIVACTWVNGQKQDCGHCKCRTSTNVTTHDGYRNAIGRCSECGTPV